MCSVNYRILPELEIVRWCAPLARDRKTRVTMMPVMIGKMMTLQPLTSFYYVDNPVKFKECMSGYGYSVTGGTDEETSR